MLGYSAESSPIPAIVSIDPYFRLLAVTRNGRHKHRTGALGNHIAGILRLQSEVGLARDTISLNEER
jgi:hypothetical protein